MTKTLRRTRDQLLRLLSRQVELVERGDVCHDSPA